MSKETTLPIDKVEISKFMREELDKKYIRYNKEFLDCFIDLRMSRFKESTDAITILKTTVRYNWVGSFISKKCC